MLLEVVHGNRALTIQSHPQANAGHGVGCCVESGLKI
jgi:hypothetical protein